MGRERGETEKRKKKWIRRRNKGMSEAKVMMGRKRMTNEERRVKLSEMEHE